MMASQYLLCKIEAIDEVLYALLGDFDFESFEELDNYTLAYIKTANANDAIINEINEIMIDKGYAYAWSEVPDQNWNEVWESNFEAVHVENLCRIRAEFHPSDATFNHEIVIQPKMAFGTGHHETTYMMIMQMSKMDFINKMVFDYGAGTGILAIYASMLGAFQIDALDVEEESYLSTIENAVKNGRQNISSHHGDIVTMEGRQYDIILANINRNVLLQTGLALSKMLNEGGLLLLSGILETDVDVIKTAFENSNFKLIETVFKGSWACMKMEKQ